MTKKSPKKSVTYLGVTLTRPNAKTQAKILKRVRENDRKGNWISDREVRPQAYQ